MFSPPTHPAAGKGTFQFERDTFAFPNELYWDYHIDPVTRATQTVRRSPPPTYAHRCFVLARAVRQFFYHCRFEPAQPLPEPLECRRLIRQVVSRSPRRASAWQDRIVIPGYDGLRSFSSAREPDLKAVCGGAWQSYFLRSHWRMVFPVSRTHQARMVEQLKVALHERPLPVAHLFRFPQLTINHGIVLFGEEETPAGVQFVAYDPNIPAHPVLLQYDRASRTFFFPATHYWAGGRVDVYETYCGGLF